MGIVLMVFKNFQGFKNLVTIFTTVSIVFNLFFSKQRNFNLYTTFVAFEVLVVLPKSLYISQPARNFYGTEIEIWDDFGPVGITEKKFWLIDHEQLLRLAFSCF